MQWLFYMIMQTVCVVQRLHMKDMVYRFKSGSIYSLCGSFPPFLPSLSIRWLPSSSTLCGCESLFILTARCLSAPLHLLLPLPCFCSCSSAFSSCFILLSSLLIFETFFFSSFLHLYLLWFVPSFHRIFPLFDLTSHYLSWLIDSHCSLSA